MRLFSLIAINIGGNLMLEEKNLNQNVEEQNEELENEVVEEVKDINEEVVEETTEEAVEETTEEVVEETIEETEDKEPKKLDKKEIIKLLVVFGYPLVALIIFLLTGLIGKAWNLNWLLLFTIPVYWSALYAWLKKNLYFFLFPLLCVCVYLFIGLAMPDNKGWHPWWLLLLEIPVYYAAVYLIGAVLKEEKTEEITEEVVEEVVEEAAEVTAEEENVEKKK